MNCNPRGCCIVFASEHLPECKWESSQYLWEISCLKILIILLRLEIRVFFFFLFLSKKPFWPHFNGRSRVPLTLQCHYAEIGCFLSTSEGWRAKSIMQPPSGFTKETPNWLFSALTTTPNFLLIKSVKHLGIYFTHLTQ